MYFPLLYCLFIVADGCLDVRSVINCLLNVCFVCPLIGTYVFQQDAFAVLLFGMFCMVSLSLRVRLRSKANAIVHGNFILLTRVML